jgi:protein-disulfide isomerase
MRWSGALTLVVLVGCACLPAAVAPPIATTVPTVSATVSPTATPEPVALEPRTPTGEYFLGRVEAPLTLEMFGDFQCPVCGEFARTVEPSFFKQYVDTGKVRFVWRDFPWIGDESFLAAQAARCAGRQGQFWAYHDYLFAHQLGENLGQFAATNLETFAAALGLEPNTFSACLGSGPDGPTIKQAVSFGVANGVDVTPAFLINGDLKIGAPPPSRFNALMEYYLARSPH